MPEIRVCEWNLFFYSHFLFCFFTSRKFSFSIKSALRSIFAVAADLLESIVVGVLRGMCKRKESVVPVTCACGTCNST